MTLFSERSLRFLGGPVLVVFAGFACDDESAGSDMTDTGNIGDIPDIASVDTDTTSPDVGPDTDGGDTDLARDTSGPDTVDTTDDADTAETSEPTCSPDQTSVLTPERMACDTNRGFCRERACFEDDNVCDYTWGERLTILHTFEIGDQADEVEPATGVPVDTCCFDLVGDAAVDNALGRGFRNLKAVGLDLNAEFAEQIRRARLNYIFDFFDLADFAGSSPIPDDPYVEFVGYETVHQGAEDIAVIASGTASFGMRHRSFFLPSRLPRIGGIGAIRDGRFVSPDARFTYILSTVDEGLAEFPIRKVRMEFDLAPGPNGKGLTLSRGRLGGVLAVDEFFGALNAEVVEACACREFVGGYGPLDATTLTCRPATAEACDEEAPLCMLLTNLLACQVFVDSFVPDYDLDGDGTLDGLTTGTRFEGTSAEITSWYDTCPRP